MGKLDRRDRTWPQEVKEQALTLYLQGKPVDLISEELEIPIDTLSYWRKTDGWVGQKNKLQEMAKEAQLATLVAKMLTEKQEMWDDLQDVQNISRDAVNDNELQFKDKKQAVDALLSAVKGKNDMISETIPLLFLQEIMEIITDEVSEEETKLRIGERLLNLGRSWTAR
jgi:transposase-like protein